MCKGYRVLPALKLLAKIEVVVFGENTCGIERIDVIVVR